MVLTTTKPPPVIAPCGFTPAAPSRQASAGRIRSAKAFEDVDPHRPLAAHPITRHAIKAAIDLPIDRDRRAAAAGKMQQIVQSLVLLAFMRQRPELHRERRAASA